ncbi:MAG TPA: GAF domain-containing protein, partial [Anaerolineaceae bacterium]|nr:GAF domain-containing protein [Anaerolineaceae bacterium]
EALDALRQIRRQGEPRLDFEQLTRRKDGSAFPARITLAPLDGEQFPAGSVLYTLTELTRSPIDELFPAAVTPEVERLRRLAEINQAISSELEAEQILQQAVRHSAALVRAGSAAGAVLSPGGEHLGDPFLLSPAGAPIPELLGKSLGEQELALGLYVAGTAGPLLIPDLKAASKGSEGAAGDLAQRWTAVLSRWQRARVRSLILVPFTSGAERLGVMVFFRMAGEPVFSEEDLTALTTIGQQAGANVHNARLHRQQALRLRELKTLRSTLNQITGELNLPRLLGEITQQSVDLLRATGGELSLYHPAQQACEVVVSYQMPDDRTGRRFALNDGAAGTVAASQRPMIVDNITKWPGEPPNYADLPPAAALLMPLTAGLNLVGVILVADTNQRRVFSADDVRLLGLFAQQASVAIENARLVREARSEAAEAETLRQASAVVTATLKPTEIIDRILEQLARVVPYDRSAVHIVRDGETELVGGRGFADPKAMVGQRFKLDERNPATQVIRESRPLLFEDVQRHFEGPPPAENHVRAWMGVPMVIHNRVIGLLTLDSGEEMRFAQRHVRLVSAFADQVAIALENARLYQRALQAAERLATLYTAGQEIAASLIPADVYDALRRAVTRLMPFDLMLLGRFNAEKTAYESLFYVTPEGHRLLHDEPLTSEPELVERLLAGKSMRTGRLDPNAVDRIVTSAQTGGKILSMLAVPQMIGGRVVGLMAVYSRRPQTYTSDDERLLELLASQSAVAIDNAHLFREVQEMAFTDPLTGLFNRRHFFELARNEFSRSLRYARPLAMIMIDLDSFKEFNDRYGHFTGDQVLVGLAQRFQESLRGVDLIGRYGGEEFIVLLPETGGQQALEVAERLRRRVAETAIETGKGPLGVTVSLGVGVYSPECDSLETLI